MAGVMGFPVMHSRSPKLHNYWLEKHDIAGRYMPLAVKPENIEKALRALPALGFSGCNLTMPHKETAVGIMDHISPQVKKVGAMNCVIVAEDGSLEGHNFEAFGYAESLALEVPGWRADAGTYRAVRRRRRRACCRRGSRRARRPRDPGDQQVA